MSGHSGSAVVEDDKCNVLLELDCLRNGNCARMEKRRVAHKDNFFICHERIGSRPRSTTKPHPRVVVHEVVCRREHQQSVATRITMKQQIDGFAVVGFLHVSRVHETPFDVEAQRSGITVRASGAENR